MQKRRYEIHVKLKDNDGRKMQLEIYIISHAVDRI
jgi:hypothetical protein